MASIVVAVGLLGAPGASASSRGAVVGFGDSVAAGYGLSTAAEWPSSFGSTSYLGSRFAHGGRCSSTRRAYSCVLAAGLRVRRRSRRNYAIQGASSGVVLHDELPQAMSEMSAAARAAVKTVTLTVGANDYAFDQCIQAEFQATPDPCLVGSLSSLRLSPAWQTRVDQLSGDSAPSSGQASLPMVIDALGRAFPNSTVYVTTYYSFVPGSVRPRRSPCEMYALPALQALVTNLNGLSTNDAIQTGAQYLHDLSFWMTLFQNRFARVAAFLQGQLNSAIRRAVRAAVAVSPDASVSAPTPVVVVPLDRLFRRHHVCSRRPWVFNVRIAFTLSASLFGIGGTTNYSSGKRCPFPMPQVGTPPASVERTQPFSFSASSSAGSISVAGSGATNCLPHPTPTGQRKIAAAARRARHGPRYCPPPGGHPSEGVFGIRARGVSCAFARHFVVTSRTNLCGLSNPTGRARCRDRGWACKVGSSRAGGGILARCAKRRRYVAWNIGF